jgi:hypothetical protein
MAVIQQSVNIRVINDSEGVSLPLYPVIIEGRGNLESAIPVLWVVNTKNSTLAACLDSPTETNLREKTDYFGFGERWLKRRH